jgi:protein-tyrosine phosphatase
VIDLHAHVLPGVDDGARDLEEALGMLRVAAGDGTKTVCATPHAHGPDYDVPRARAEEAFAALSRAAAEAGIPIEVRLASEVWYRPDLATLAREGRLASFSGSGRRYVLIEFPPTHVPPEAEEVYFRLRLEGYTPVIAHPERNPGFWGAGEKVERFREQGALVQVTAGSLTGMFRAEARRAAKDLVRRGAVDLIASDCHRTDRRPPGLSEAAQVLGKWAGKSEAERLTVGVPAAILAGAAAPGAP